jgi:hypothetical protein
MVCLAATAFAAYTLVVYCNVSSEVWAICVLVFLLAGFLVQLCGHAVHACIWLFAERSALSRERSRMHDHVHEIELEVSLIPESEESFFKTRFGYSFPKTVFLECESTHLEIMVIILTTKGIA